MLHWQEGLDNVRDEWYSLARFEVMVKALGQKEGRTDGEANTIAFIRTNSYSANFYHEFLHCGNAVRHWNNTGTAVYVCVDKPNDGYYCVIVNFLERVRLVEDTALKAALGLTPSQVRFRSLRCRVSELGKLYTYITTVTCDSYEDMSSLLSSAGKHSASN